MYCDKQRFWEAAMLASIVACSEWSKSFGPAQTAERAAKMADAATDEFVKREKAGMFDEKEDK